MGVAMRNASNSVIPFHDGQRWHEWQPKQIREVSHYQAQRLVRTNPRFFREVKLVDMLEQDKQKAWGLIRNGGLGDLIMLMPVYLALKERYPNGVFYMAQEYFPLLNEVTKGIVSFQDQSLAKERLLINLCGYPEREQGSLQAQHRTQIFADKLGLSADFDRKNFGAFGSWTGKQSEEIALFPDCRCQNRYWSWSCWERLAIALQQKGFRVKFYTDKPKRIGSFSASKIRLSEFSSVLASCRCAVGLDSGAMHLAGAMGVPFVALMTSFPKETRCSAYESVMALQKHAACRCFSYSCSNPKRPCAAFTVEEVTDGVSRLIRTTSK